MKQKLLLNCIIALIFSSSAFAQFQKGNKVMGFGLGFSAGKAETQNNSFAPIKKTTLSMGTLSLVFQPRDTSFKVFLLVQLSAKTKLNQDSRQIIFQKTRINL
jgi:hypothetical protein